jgi:hypothetical protein
MKNTNVDFKFQAIKLKPLKLSKLNSCHCKRQEFSKKFWVKIKHQTSLADSTNSDTKNLCCLRLPWIMKNTSLLRALPMQWS